MGILISVSPDFFPSVLQLEATEGKKVLKAVDRFSNDPNYPALNLHPVKSDAKNRLYTIRASDELRVLLVRLGENKWVAQESGHHDAIYSRAETGQFIIAFDGDHIGFYSTKPSEKKPHSKNFENSEKKPEVGPVLRHWSDSELEEIGFTSLEVGLIRHCVDFDELLSLEIPDSKIELAIDLLETTPEVYKARLSAPPKLVEVSSSEVVPIETFTKHGTASGFSDFFGGVELGRILNEPIEKWMIFLHPQQKEIVDRVYAGPARIGGSAGTGKTVVALHRAASLAKKYQGDNSTPQILFTTFIKSLPPYFEKLYSQLPNSVPNSVRFIHVDGLANEICKMHGREIEIDAKMTDELFTKAFSSVATASSAISQSKLGAKYVREEIDYVIRGRMVKSVEEYLGLERTGRKTALQPTLRKQVWRIHEKYRDLKSKKNAFDFTDRMEIALAYSQKSPALFRCAIIDEAQDLSLLSLRLIRNLVNGGKGKDLEDGLLLVGDGAQRIYASCFTLSQAGLQVRGRSTILERNYRNTREILKAAFAVAGNRDVEDLGNTIKTPSRISSALPRGGMPLLVQANSIEQRTAYIAAKINNFVETTNYEYGDIGVLGPYNKLVDGFAVGLSRSGIPTVRMKEDRNQTANHVRVGTFHRAKGLEFKVVFLLGLENYPSKMKRGEAATTFADRHDLELNIVFVAMTRAREHLEIVVTGEPSGPLVEARQYLKNVKNLKI